MPQEKNEKKNKGKKAFTGEMPHNLEAEQSLLGCLAVDRDIQLDVISQLCEEDFYSESHGYIFNAMAEINKQNVPVDLVTLIDELEKEGNLEAAGGISYLTNLTKIMPSTANYRYYLDIIKRDAVLRRLIRSSQAIIQNAVESSDKGESVAFAEKEIFDVSMSLDTSSMVRIDALVPEVLQRFNAISKDKDAFQGLQTGFRQFDLLTNGLHETDLVLLAARPAMGKTSFAMNIVENIATTQNKVCAVFSLEMGREQLTQRMLCSLAEVSMQKALKGQLDKDEWKRLAEAQNKLNAAKIFIDDSAMITPAEMLSKCRRLKRKYGLDLVMIDYLQLMNSGTRNSSDSRQNEISEISRNMKILAKEIKVPVLALSQLSRAVESRTGHKPQLSDLRESGAIEQDADIVMFIHRPDKYAEAKDMAEGKVQANVAEILVEKHRNGPTGVVKLYFKGECTKFLNLSDEAVPSAPRGGGAENGPPPEDDYVPPQDGDVPWDDGEPARLNGADAGFTPPADDDVW